MTADHDAPEHLPAKAGELARSHPDIWKAYAALGSACASAGPLDAAQQRLVKLALALGAASEGAAHSHTRRAMAEGHDPAILKQIALLAIPMLGFANGMRMLSWIEDVTDAGKVANRED
ncbi:MAG: carboxymuconolactone decarboxylase family protein [Blastochloris sp.]|nr:carboxymuconolactone decarboxylase family protein [Blastochloris sp.]